MRKALHLEERYCTLMDAQAFNTLVNAAVTPASLIGAFMGLRPSQAGTFIFGLILPLKQRVASRTNMFGRVRVIEV
jgi:hypothetical protein